MFLWESGFLAKQPVSAAPEGTVVECPVPTGLAGVAQPAVLVPDLGHF